MIRAKFCVESVEDAYGGKRITLRAVYEGSPENKEFFRYTPSGYIDLSTINLDAAARFAPGKQFYVDFTEGGE